MKAIPGETKTQIDLLDRLRSMNGITWGTKEINMMCRTLQFAGMPLDAKSALLAGWAGSTFEGQQAATADWPAFVEKFYLEFQRRFPSGLPLQRPSKVTKVVYEPSHPDIVHIVTPDTLRAFEVPDFYADGQFAELQAAIKNCYVQTFEVTSK